MNISKTIYGIVQGRLTETPNNELQRFPQESWQEEFMNVKNVGLKFIELLTERNFNSKNPVWTLQGRNEIKALCKKFDNIIYSICADYIIDHSIIDNINNNCFVHIEKLFAVALDLDCKVIVLPLLEKSEVNSYNLNQYVPIIQNFSSLIENTNITICIESLLSSDDLLNFIRLIDKQNVRIVFDTGNRVVQNLNLEDEILRLRDTIKHVHIKDKDKDGNNVILGSGLVDFSKVFNAFNEINYSGPLVFETTRGGNPIITAKKNIAFCEHFINKN